MSSRDQCLSCEWTHSQEEKGNFGHGHSHHPRGVGQVAVGLCLGIQLVHPEVKAASGQRHISTAGHLLRAFSKMLSALFLGSWYYQGLSPHFLSSFPLWQGVRHIGWENGLWPKTAWVQFPALPFTSYEILGKMLNLSVLCPPPPSRPTELPKKSKAQALSSGNGKSSA